ncbi:MAG TPA: DUF6048 family protein [Chitinophagaceae bacterium]|nr:DUF6048 family protein [Chitinophagaceae bacterium]
MRRTYNFIFISLFLFSLINFNLRSFAQEVDSEVENSEEQVVQAPNLDSLEINGEKENKEKKDAEKENSEEEKKKTFLEKKEHPYLAIGINVGRLGYKLLQENSQEYNLFAFYSLSKKIFLHTEFGFGKENIKYPHLIYNTQSSYLQIAIQYNFFKESHEWDRDRIYVSPFLQVHAGSISEAKIHMENQSGFIVEDIIPSNKFFKSSVGVRFNVEMEILPKILLSWHGQAALLIGANRFKDIKPQFIAGYGNADRNVNFQFGVNLAYYFGR